MDIGSLTAIPYTPPTPPIPSTPLSPLPPSPPSGSSPTHTTTGTQELNNFLQKHFNKTLNDFERTSKQNAISGEWTVTYSFPSMLLTLFLICPSLPFSLPPFLFSSPVWMLLEKHVVHSALKMPNIKLHGEHFTSLLFYRSSLLSLPPLLSPFSLIASLRCCWKSTLLQWVRISHYGRSTSSCLASTGICCRVGQWVVKSEVECKRV